MHQHLTTHHQSSDACHPDLLQQPVADLSVLLDVYFNLPASTALRKAMAGYVMVVFDLLNY